VSNLSLQLERLRRHHHVAIRSYDEVSLVELSHVLRVWADLRTQLPTISPRFSSSIAFTTAIPAKKLSRLGSDRRSVFCYVPDGVTISTTSAGNSQLFATLGDEEDNVQVYLAAAVKRTASSITLKNYVYLSPAPEQEIAELARSAQVKRCSFAQWLGSEIVRGTYRRETAISPFSFSRDLLIRRLANEYEASHPLDLERLSRSPDDHSRALAHLMQHRILGLPLPYYMALSVAERLLENASKHVAHWETTPPS
jgi:hypothetical protein